MVDVASSTKMKYIGQIKCETNIRPRYETKTSLIRESEARCTRTVHFLCWMGWDGISVLAIQNEPRQHESETCLNVVFRFLKHVSRSLRRRSVVQTTKSGTIVVHTTTFSSLFCLERDSPSCASGISPILTRINSRIMLHYAII